MTPVWIESPDTIVVCPTRTPATSVIAFSAPGAKMPGATPRSRARTRVGWELAGSAVIKVRAAGMRRRMGE